MPRIIAPLLLILSLLLPSCTLFEYESSVNVYLSPAERDSIQSLAAQLRDQGKKLRGKSEFIEALELQQKALDLSLQLKDTLNIVQDYNNLGTTYRRLGHLEQALHHHYLAMNCAEAYHEDSTKQAIKNRVFSYNGLGNVYLTYGNEEKAKVLLHKALEGETKIGNQLGMAINYANLGSIYESQNMLDSAQWYYERSMEMNIQQQSTMGMSLCYVHFGQVLEKRDSVVAAEAEYRKALALMEGNEDRYHYLDVLKALSLNLLRQGKLAEVQQYAEVIHQLADELHSTELLRESAALYAKMYEAMGNYHAAYEQLQICKAWDDSIAKPINDNKLREACINYEIQNSRKKVDELQAALEDNDKMHNFIIYVELALVVILIVAILLLMYAYKNRNARIEALNRLDNMRNTFFRNVTHEFRTPLTVIMGLSDQLKQGHTTEEQQRNMLDTIKQHGHTLLNLVNELLSISRIVSGHEQCEWRNGDVVTFLRVSFSGYAEYAKTRNIELHFVTSQDKIMMDFVPDYLQKILNNLISNSFNYTASGGSITLKLGLKSNHLTIDMIDTGQGISAEDLPHIFELFYQGHSADKHCNSGIGLPYVQQMVRQMGGIITAENYLPHGTAMHIVLSCKCSDERVTEIKPWTLDDSIRDVALHPLNLTADHAENLTEANLPLVMIVEDHPDIADYIALLLQGRYRVMKATDAFDAFNKMGHHKPAMIITDVMMPGMDGFEFCRSLKRSANYADIMVVMESARVEESDRKRAMECGASAYVFKPFEADEFNRLIDGLFT